MWRNRDDNYQDEIEYQFDSGQIVRICKKISYLIFKYINHLTKSSQNHIILLLSSNTLFLYLDSLKKNNHLRKSNNLQNNHL